ncbi:MAG TPA: ATP-binding cassette domain-containing protein [Polyangiaceae bacterium]
MSSPVLECRDVSAGYPGDGGSRTTVLEHVTFAVPRAARVVVIGRSGSGKSTLLRLLNRLEDPQSGAVFFEGRPLIDEDPLVLRRAVALVLQMPVVFDGTVRENLSVRSRPGRTPAPPEAELAILLTEVGLSPAFLDRRAEALSVGEKQRMCIARALVSKPRALLLDEPTSALDPRSLGVVADLVLSLAERHSLSVVAATHQPELARRLGGSVIHLVDGSARTDASVEDVARFFEGLS